MKKRGSIIIITLVISFLVGSLVISSSNEPPRVLVLHSYSTDYVWTNLVTHDLNKSFRDIASFAQVRYFYLKARQLDYSDKAASIHNFFLNLAKAYDPEIIIAIDDTAQKVISEFFLNDEDIDIVFAGVNDKIEPYNYQNANNVTGIFEHKPIAAIKKVILQINELMAVSGEPSVLFLADSSTSSYNNANFLRNYKDWSGFNYQGAKHTKTFNEWKQFILKESSKYDYILVSGYRQLLDEHEKRVKASAVAKWTQSNSESSVIGMNVFNSEDGILLSVSISPYEQGRKAVELASRILDGEDPEDIPYLLPKNYIVSLSEDALANPRVIQPYKRIFKSERPLAYTSH